MEIFLYSLSIDKMDSIEYNGREKSKPFGLPLFIFLKLFELILLLVLRA